MCDVSKQLFMCVVISDPVASGDTDWSEKYFRTYW